MPILVFDPATELDQAKADAAWLKARKLGIGASEVGVLTGSSPWSSQYALWCNKRGITPDVEQTERMSMGKKMERTIMALLLEDEDFIKEYGAGCASEPCQRLYRAEEYEHVLCTPDALVRGPGIEGVLMVECKNTRADDLWGDGIPEHVVEQVQQQMVVMGQARCVVAWLLHGDTFRWQTVQADAATQGRLIRTIEGWWKKHMVDGVAPATDGLPATTNALKHRFAEIIGQVVPLDGSFIELDERRLVVEGEIKSLTLELDAIKNRFRDAIGNAPAGMLPNGVMYSASVVKKDSYTVKASAYKELRRKAPKETK